MRLSLVRVRPALASLAALAFAVAAPAARAQEACRCDAPVAADTQDARLPAVRTSRWAPRGAGALPMEFLLPGMRVRLDAPGYVHSRALFAQREGVIVAQRGDSILFDGAMHRELVLVPVSRIRSLDVSTGRGPTARNTVLGSIVGASVGMMGGVLVNLAGNDGGEDACASGVLPGCASERRTVFTSAAIGALVGTVVGNRIPQYRWRPVSLR